MKPGAMTAAEWMERIERCRDPNAARLMCVANAFLSPNANGEVRQLMLRLGLNLTEAQLEAAFEELRRVGLLTWEWPQ